MTYQLQSMTMTKEPASVAILSARIMRAYPSLSPYSAAFLAADLETIERAQRRHAERCCSGEDGGYVKREPTHVHGFCVHGDGPCATARRIAHDPDAERRAGERIDARCSRWLARLGELAHCDRGKAPDPTADMIDVQDDPRGAVLLLRLPGEAEAVAV